MSLNSNPNGCGGLQDVVNDTLYGSGVAIGEAGGGDVGLGGNAAMAEEATLEDEGAGEKAEQALTIYATTGDACSGP